MLLFILQLIKTETVTGFQKYENEQYLNVSYESGYKSIKESMLYEKKSTDDDYVYVRSLKKYTRWCISKEQYKKSLEEESEEENENNAEETTENTSDKEKKRIEKKYDEIFVDLNKIKKDSDTVYYIEIKVIDMKDDEDSINTRSFVYSKQQDRWIFSDKPDSKKESWWKNYIVIGVVGVLALGVFVYLLI